MTNSVTVSGLLERLAAADPGAPIHIERALGREVRLVRWVGGSASAPGTVAVCAAADSQQSDRADSVATVADFVQQLQTLSQALGASAPVRIEAEADGEVSFIMMVGEGSYTPGTVALVAF